jgi:hypothetical protein
MKKIIATILLLSGLASASDLLGPVWNLKGKHVGDGEPLSWTIEYYDAWGRTVTDMTGGHFYHDRCCGGVRTDDPSWVYPKAYHGTTPMYYCGTTMRYRLTLTNNGTRKYENLRVVAVQEYLNPTGTWGERIGPDAARDWYLKSLKAGESVTFEGTCAIPYEAHGGLDQTHLQVQHWTGGKGKPGPGSVIIDDAKAAIWCPPDQQTLAESASAMNNPLPGSVKVLAGGRGFVEPGVAARFEVRPAGSGLVSLKVFDRNGTLVREVSRYTGGGIEVMGWDGVDAGGRQAVSGVYLAVITGPGVQARERVALLR